VPEDNSKNIYKMALRWWYKTPYKIRLAGWKLIRMFDNGEGYQKISFQGKTYAKGTDRFKSYKQLFPSPPVNKTILDVGCNFGYYSLMALQEKAAYCRAIDNDPLATKKLEEIALDLGFNDLDIVQADILNYDIDRDFDIVLCLNLIHHFESFEQAEKLLDTLYRHTIEKMMLIVLAPVDLEKASLLDTEINPAGGKRFLGISPHYFIAKYGQTRVNVKHATSYGPNRYTVVIEKSPAT